MKKTLKYIGIAVVVWFVGLLVIGFTIGFVRGLK